MTNLKQLETAANFLEVAMKSKGFDVDYEVKNIWKDMGAGTRHDTVIATCGDRSFQIFSPRELDKIAEDKFTLGDLQTMVDKQVEMFK